MLTGAKRFYHSYPFQLTQAKSPALTKQTQSDLISSRTKIINSGKACLTRVKSRLLRSSKKNKELRPWGSLIRSLWLWHLVDKQIWLYLRFDHLFTQRLPSSRQQLQSTIKAVIIKIYPTIKANFHTKMTIKQPRSNKLIVAKWPIKAHHSLSKIANQAKIRNQCNFKSTIKWTSHFKLAGRNIVKMLKRSLGSIHSRKFTVANMEGTHCQWVQRPLVVHFSGRLTRS